MLDLWYKNAVLYCLDVETYMDANGDGVAAQPLVVEVADAREASRSYEANLRVFEQSRQMGSALLDLIRR